MWQPLRRRIRPLAVVVLLARLAIPAHAAPPVAATGTVSGVVRVDARTPAPYADVSVRSLGRGAMSDEAGRFRLDGLPPGSYYLAAIDSGLPELAAASKNCFSNSDRFLANV